MPRGTLFLLAFFKKAILLFLSVSATSPMANAENAAVACMLTFDASAGNCAKNAVPLLNVADIVAAVGAFNSYTSACCHHPNPDYVKQHFHIVLPPNQIKQVPSRCVTDLWNMDDRSDTVSCSGDVQYNLIETCRVLFGLPIDTDTLIFVFNIPKETCESPALGGNRRILFTNHVNADYLARTVVHEMGHNFHIQHSNTIGGEYGDVSDPMGSGDQSTCYSAVNSNLLGWSTSLTAPMVPSQQAKDVWMPFAVPAMAKQNAFANHLIIVSDDGLAMAFLSFRDAVSVKGASYDQTSTKSAMANLLGKKVTAFRKISVHYVKSRSTSKFPMRREEYNDAIMMVDTIDLSTTWSSAPFFGASAAYRNAPLAGPFAVSFDSYDSANNLANIRICFLRSESDVVSNVCKSKTVVETFVPRVTRARGTGRVNDSRKNVYNIWRTTGMSSAG